MGKEQLIEQIKENLQLLPESKIKEVNDFIVMLSKQDSSEMLKFISLLISEREDELLTQGIMKLAEQSKSYHFLLNEEDLYKVEDLKEIYNAKR